MQGLKLSKKYYEQIGEPLLQDQFSSVWNRVAAGLVGSGSDCFGFDDELSRDHDWGPGFCIWLTSEDMQRFGSSLSQAYDRLPKNFCGFSSAKETKKRTGVFSIESFYENLLGSQLSLIFTPQWISIPEEKLASAVNGSVFRDPPGTFTHIRKTLRQYFPLSLQQIKLAAYCEEAGKAGQYTYIRSLSRGEIMAANGALQRFSEAVCRIVYLLNRAYCPKYKWLHRGIRELPILGSSIYPLLQKLACSAGAPAEKEKLTAIANQQTQRIDTVCALLCDELRRQGFSRAPDNLLLPHSTFIRSCIPEKEQRCFSGLLR